MGLFMFDGLTHGLSDFRQSHLIETNYYFFFQICFQFLLVLKTFFYLHVSNGIFYYFENNLKLFFFFQSQE